MDRGGYRRDRERALLLRTGLVRSGLSVRELKLACRCIGDEMDLAELAFVLSGSGPLPDRRYDVIARAINDRLLHLGLPDQRVRSAA